MSEVNRSAVTVVYYAGYRAEEKPGHSTIVFNIREYYSLTQFVKENAVPVQLHSFIRSG